jgi:hypothetical protein
MIHICPIIFGTLDKVGKDTEKISMAPAQGSNASWLARKPVSAPGTIHTDQ